MPSSGFREILIFVAGSTPQIVTETIQALAEQNPPVYAHEVYVITTGAGKRRAIQKLVTEGILEQMVRDYDLPPIKLTEDSFIVITGSDGAELDDIRTVDANERAGDIIADFLRLKAAEPDTRLHCSLSGGRKSMSFYMGLAFQLFGRQWDKLYHVLVPPELERNPDFFYRPRGATTLTVKKGNGATREIRADEAEVTLVDLPLIQLRDTLSLRGGGVRQIVAAGQREIENAPIKREIKVSLVGRRVTFGTKVVEFHPTQLMFYTTFLRFKLNECRDPDKNSCGDCTDCFKRIKDMSLDPKFVETLAKEYQVIYRNDVTKAEELIERYPDGMEEQVIRQQISKIKSTIIDQLGDERLFDHYGITSSRTYGANIYGVRIDRKHIFIE